MRISVSSGTETAVLYRAPDAAAVWSTLTSDASGRFLILGNDFFSRHMGWIDAGRLRQLAGPGYSPVAW